MKAYLFVALGGSLGAVLRYFVAGFVQQLAGGLFPWGTLSVNVVGSFLLGALYEASMRAVLPPEWRLFWAVGVLGAFTTFSTLSFETLGFFREGALVPGLVYALGSLALGVAAALLGVWWVGR